MVPNQTFDPTQFSPTESDYANSGFDCSNTGSVTVYRFFTSTNWADSHINSSWDTPTIRPDILTAYARFFNNAEKAYLRRINCKPTIEGVKICGNWHTRSGRCASLTPHFRVRFDRRVPCWRAGRWKSLT